MKTITSALLMTAIALAGCTQTKVADNGKTHMGYLARPDYFRQRVTFTGSHIPQDPNRPTMDILSANTPSQSVARDRPSLYPTEPVVGTKSGDADGDTGPSNVGAGPAGSSPLPSTRANSTGYN